MGKSNNKLFFATAKFLSTKTVFLKVNTTTG